MSAWLLTIVIIVSMPVSDEPQIASAEARLVNTEQECMEAAKRATAKFESIGSVAVTCDPVGAMPYIKRRGQKI